MPSKSPAPKQISVKLSKRTRSQLHYLMVQRSLTTDENVTISGIIAAAVGAFARACGWRAEGLQGSPKTKPKSQEKSVK